MDPYNVLRQPTILPVICDYLRPYERKSLFISIGYIPSACDKTRYFNVLDELFDDREQLEYLVKNNTSIIIYGNNVPLINRPNRSNIGVGIHFYSSIRIQVDDVDAQDKEEIIEKSFKTKRGRILNDIQGNMHISSNMDSYDDVYNQESLIMSYSHRGIIIASDASRQFYRRFFNLSIPGVRDSQPIDFTLDILNELDEMPDVFSDVKVHPIDRCRYFETAYLSISKLRIHSGRLYIMTTKGQACSGRGVRNVTILNARDEHKRYISLPTRWIDYAIQ